MKKINSRRDLIKLAEELGVRPDWHEPDEQDLTASIHGVSFDNAGFWPLEMFSPQPLGDAEARWLGTPNPRPTPPHAELYVTLHRGEVPVAQVNLATLFSWATGFGD